MIHFHFLRPEWLLLLFSIPLAIFVLKRAGNAGQSDWSKSIPPHLLQHLLPAKQVTQSQTRVLPAVPLMITLAALALAGPTWQKKPQPVHQKQDNLVVMLDLSLSMLAQDVKPDRITRASQKIRDLLHMRKEGNTALIAYAGDSHVVTPLTNDVRTISAMLPALNPTMMPVMGSTTHDAVKQAIDLLKQSHSINGRLLLVTDGVSKKEAEALHAELENTDYPLDILSVGTPTGAPIPIPGQGYLKDNNNKVVVAKVDEKSLTKIARDNKGIERNMSLDDSDILALNATKALSGWSLNAKSQQNLIKLDLWFDEGYWLILIIIPLALLGYRKGLLLPLLVLTVFSSVPQRSMAASWNDLWKTPDQQAYELLKKNPKAAADKFESERWKAIAEYQSKQYENADKSLSSLHTLTADDFYNKGNALAKAKKYKDAIKAYDESLKIAPNNQDALFNKKLVEKLLKQQQKQNKKNNKNKKQNQKGNKGKNGKNGQSGNSQNKNQKNNKNQSKNEQNNKQQKNQSNQSNQQNSGKNDKQQDKNQQHQAKGSSKDQQNKQQQQQQQQQQQKSENKKQAESKAEQAKEAEKAKKTGQPEDDNLAHLTKEEKQSYEQWMRRVPDDPGGLLRRKFEMQYQQQGNQSYVQGAPIW
jgi:Ca-activated chloride channel family protein